MNGRFGKPDNDKVDNVTPIKNSDGKPAPAPTPLPDDDEEDGDIATPKRDRDDESP